MKNPGMILNMSLKKAQTKKFRQAFREGCLERDKYKCVICGETDGLDVHHITDRKELPNGGYVLENGITLCAAHHLDAEQYHITRGSYYFPGFHPAELYDRIDSSQFLARQKSIELST